MGIIAAVLSGFFLAAAAPWLSPRLGRAGGWVLALLPAALTAYFAAQVPAVASGLVRTAGVPWVPSLGVSFSFLLDGLSLLFALLICGIGALIVVYTGGYLAGHPHLHRFYGYLLLFMASMVGLVLADDVITLFVFWELTTLSSYLLIGFEHERPAARAAALQALLVTGIGGLSLLAGLLLLGQAGGTLQLSELLQRGEAVRAHPLFLPALLLVLGGAFTKSAQVPFHFWLSSAMEAPTPVSAYLHSATMVKAGVFLLARLSPVLGEADAWRWIVSAVGAATMVVGAGLALLHTDLKRLLAYSTVSALGVLTMLLGLGTPLAAEVAMVFLLAHALYKGALFLVAGIIEHETGDRDIRRLGGLGRAMPVTAFAAALAALSMAGLPPMFGFVGKELLYRTALESADPLSVLPVVTVASGVLFVVLAALAGLRPFWSAAEAPAAAPAHEAPASMWAGPLLLGVLGVAFGLVPNLAEDSLLAPAVTAVLGRPFDFVVALWHGIDTVLILTVITVAAGAYLYGRRRDLWRLSAWIHGAAIPGAAASYAAALRGLDIVAGALTRFVQHGYLRIYLLTTVAAVTILGWATLAVAERSPTAWADARLYEVAVAAVIVVAALSAAVSRSRLGAAVALGVVGYGIALEYLFFGAPDLALTQFMVETLTVILFVLVFYHLPRFAALSSPMTRVRDAGVAILAGGLMTALLLSGSPAERAVSAFFAERSVPDGHGRNIVNVILVDFRGLDTLGEITVLAVAAVGVYVLLKLRPDVPGR